MKNINAIVIEWQKTKDKKDSAIIIEHMKPTVKYYVNKITVDKDFFHKEDAESEGICAILEAAQRFSLQHKTSFKTFATIYIKFYIIKYITKINEWDAINIVTDKTDNFVSDIRTPEENYIVFEMQKDLYRQIKRLPDICFQVFKLYVFDSLTFASIGAKLGISKESARLHYISILSIIKEIT